MDTGTEETEFDDQTFFSASLLFSLSVVINGNKTDVTFNTCGKGTYYAVNLVRNGYCVNSYTMISSFDAVSKSAGWRFEERPCSAGAKGQGA